MRAVNKGYATRWQIRLALVGLSLWAGGMLAFGVSVPGALTVMWTGVAADRFPGSSLLHVDAIVVLTGPEPARLVAGFRLLEAGAAPLLLISGAGDPADYLDAYRPQGVCCYAIDHARDTLENAAFTAAWVAQHRIRTLLLVTSDYHMRRAAWLLHRTLAPGVIVHPLAVSTSRPMLLGRIFVEYHRFLIQSLLATFGVL
jgi:uncharacterized SAM-binding protein YcdF (DUF218 family)